MAGGIIQGTLDNSPTGGTPRSIAATYDGEAMTKELTIRQLLQKILDVQQKTFLMLCDKLEADPDDYDNPADLDNE